MRTWVSWFVLLQFICGASLETHSLEGCLGRHAAAFTIAGVLISLGHAKEALRVLCFELRVLTFEL